MTYTGFKAMNIEELDLVTGGTFSPQDCYTLIKRIANSSAPTLVRKKTPDGILDTFERLGADTIAFGQEAVNKVKSLLPWT